MGVVWWDATYIATGVVIGIGGLIVKDPVLSWVNSTVEESGRIHTKGTGEMIVW